MKPLEGLRVVDLSRILAGPWATQTLADLGADVVKIERPGDGDETRTWGPPFAGGDEFRESTYFLSCNRGKRSVTIDFTSPEGSGLVRRLAADADVVVENFKVGGLDKYGLDDASLRALNPRLIYCSITGFGQSGPYAAKPGYDALIQAMGGLMSITGEPDGAPGGGPQKVGVAVVDLLTAMYATTAILAALMERERSGSGQRIDLSLMDVQVAALANQGAAYLGAGVVPGRLGSAHPSIVPYQPFATADGHVMVAVANDTQFKAFCEAAGLVGLVRDPRFATNSDRVRNRSSLLSLLAEAMRAKTTAAWVEIAEKHGFPCGPINDIAGVFADPQVRARGDVIEVAHARLGPLKTTSNPMRFSRSESTSAQAPPVLSQHTVEVLSELGLTAEEIDGLRGRGVV